MKAQNTPKALCSSKKDGRKICIITGTRAEWGLLSPLAYTFAQDSFFNTSIIATGSHLSKKFGLTLQEIKQTTHLPIYTIPIFKDIKTHNDIAHCIGQSIISFTQFFTTNPCDMVVVLGDRYEIFAACIAIANLNIPIAHLCGGETTEGANDEYMRHCITKMSYLHFPTTNFYRNRIIQLGEHPSRVFNHGSLALENLMKTTLLSQQELSASLQISPSFLDHFCLLTFHPTTLESNNPKEEIQTILDCLLQSNINILATKANADFQGDQINQTLLEYSQKFPDKIILVSSLGQQKYYSATKLSKFVIGNSSSALSEAPMLQTPSIDIGDRQKGRYAPKSVIRVACNYTEISRGIHKILKQDFQFDSILPFGNGDTSQKITQTIKTFLTLETIKLKKEFFDII